MVLCLNNCSKYNLNGQLGDGTKYYSRHTSTRVTGLSSITSVSTSSSSTCTKKTTGHLLLGEPCMYNANQNFSSRCTFYAKNLSYFSPEFTMSCFVIFNPCGVMLLNFIGYKF